MTDSRDAWEIEAWTDTPAPLPTRSNEPSPVSPSAGERTIHLDPEAGGPPPAPPAPDAGEGA